MKKRIWIIVIVLIIGIACGNIVYGFSLNSISPVSPSDDKDTITPLAKGVLGYIRAIGVIISVVILIVIGIKYMVGSVEEKAEYKETLMPYVIGAVILFSASALAQIIYDFIKSL